MTPDLSDVQGGIKRNNSATIICVWNKQKKSRKHTRTLLSYDGTAKYPGLLSRFTLLLVSYHTMSKYGLRTDTGFVDGADRRWVENERFWCEDNDGDNMVPSPQAVLVHDCYDTTMVAFSAVCVRAYTLSLRSARSVEKLALLCFASHSSKHDKIYQVHSYKIYCVSCRAVSN